MPETCVPELCTAEMCEPEMCCAELRVAETRTVRCPSSMCAQLRRTRLGCARLGSASSSCWVLVTVPQLSPPHAAPVLFFESRALLCCANVFVLAGNAVAEAGARQI